MVLGAPPTRRHDVVLSWLLARAVDARARNTVEFGAGTESVLVSGVCELRRSKAACSKSPLGSGQAWLLRLRRGRGRASERPATASGARASRIQSRRFHYF
eukprot:scaffold37720_cov67-Phaeocystis_antarctica.AAC.18